jgi:competence protein ComEC
VLFGCGIGAYFGLPGEPGQWLAPVLLAAGLAAAAGGFALRQRGRAGAACWFAGLALLLAASGFADAQWRAQRVAAPVLAKDTRAVTVEGTVDAADPLGEGAGTRLILRDVKIAGMEAAETPARIRIRAVKLAPGAVQGGDRVRFRGKLTPPRAPAAPGAFDFQRYSWFRRIGGYGFAFAAPEVIEGGRPHGLLYRLRHIMQKRIASVIPGGPGAVALAFMTGSQTALGRGEADDFRASGLAHMLSVSGLHFAIVAGILFFTVRFLLVALFPRFAVAHPVKKYAALVTLAGVALYLAIVGASVPAVRSVLMAGAGLLAIVADRNPFSMRIIALAALAILAFTPEALVTASFQMSFGAVAALVWFYERTRGVWSAATLRAGWLGRPLVYVLGICATTVVASLATAPFSLYHFQQLPLYGVLGNFLAAPVLSFIVMPAIIVAYLLMPFGWDAPALHLVGFGNGLILRIAHAVAQLPHAAWTPAAWPVAGFLCAVAAGLWLLLANGRWMWGALAPLAAAALIAASPVPDVLVAQDGKLVAVLGPDRLYLSSRVHDRTSARNWAQMAGRGAKPGARWDGRDSGPARCDEYACRAEVKGHRISYIRKPAALAGECRWAEIAIAPMPLPARACRAKTRIGYYELRAQGAYALYFRGAETRIRTVNGVRGGRPWAGAPRPHG